MGYDVKSDSTNFYPAPSSFFFDIAKNNVAYVMPNQACLHINTFIYSYPLPMRGEPKRGDEGFSSPSRGILSL